MPITPPKKNRTSRRAGYAPQSATSMDEMVANLNRRYNGEHGHERIQFSYRKSEDNDGTGEIWIMRAPNAVDTEDVRTGKNFTPIRLSVDEATLRGHHGEHTVLNMRGKLITDQYEFKHNDPRASMDDQTFTDRSWIRRSSYDVAEDLIARSLGNAGEETRRDFGIRMGYLTDPYGSVGDRQTFKQMKERGDVALNAIANTISIRQPVGFGVMEDSAAKKNWRDQLDIVAQRLGFQPGTFGIASPGTTNRSEASKIPIRDLEGTNNVQQATHFAFAAAGYDPKTGRSYGPLDTGRVTLNRGQSYSAGYAADPADPAKREKTLEKEGKRASLDQRKTYMPDIPANSPVETYDSVGRRRMNRVVVIAREGDDVGAGGSISSRSNMNLRVYTPFVRQRTALPKGFQLSQATFNGRAERGAYTQAGGVVATDNDPLTLGGQRSVRVDRVGLEGVQIRQTSRQTPKMAPNPATGVLEPVKDASGNVMTQDEYRPEFRINFGYDEDTARMVSEFGIKIGSTVYDSNNAELRSIFSADVANAKQGGKWRKGVSKKTKDLYATREKIVQEVVKRVQEKNQGVWVTAAQNQGGSTSGRTSFDFEQRKEVDTVGGKGGAMKQTYREKTLPDNPEEGGEVDRYLPVAQQRLARSAMGNRAMERLVYKQDRKGNFINTAPDAALADEIDSSTGMYKYRVMRDMTGSDIENAQRRMMRIAVRERREASKNLAALRSSTANLSGVNSGDVVRISTGVGPDRIATLDQMGKRVETKRVRNLKGTHRSIVDDSDFATVRVQTGKMIRQKDASGNYVVDPATGSYVMVPEERVESYRVSSDPTQAQIFRTDTQAKIDDQEQRLKKAQRAARNMDDLGSSSNPFGRWAQNREEIIRSEIGSDFLERYVHPISALVSIGEQKTDQKFQLETMVGIFHTNLPEFQRAREVLRRRFGANNDDDVNIWTSGMRGDGVTELNDAMDEVLRVSPRVFKQGEHPLSAVDARFSGPGLYEPVERTVDSATGAVSYAPGEWKVNTINVTDPVTGKTTTRREMEDVGHVALVQSSTGFSPEYTGLGRMTSEMLRMLHKTSPELYEDIASQQIDPSTGKPRPNILMSLIPEENSEVVRVGSGSGLTILGSEADDTERFDALVSSWHDYAQKNGVSNTATIELAPISTLGEKEGFKVASPDVFIGQEQSAIGRAYFNLIASENSNYSVAEKIAARATYTSELQTFFGQQETIKNALSVSKGMVTSFSRYVTDSSVGDNEVVIGDDTVSIFAEQASKALGQNVSKEDVIAALQSKEGVYGFAPRMPEVTEFMTPFRVRYDAKNKSVPRVNEYFSMLYMGDNDADPLMMMLMGAFKKNADGTIGYSNFRQIKEMHEKAPSGLYQAAARLRSSMDPFEFEEKFSKAHETARLMLDYQLDNNLLYKKDEQGRVTKEEQNRLAAARAEYLAGKGGDEYLDTINRYAMSGLFRGRRQVDASGQQVMDPRDSTKPLEIKGMNMTVGANRSTGNKGKTQNVEMDRQDDLRAGSPNSVFGKLTSVKRHVFGSEEVSKYNKREEQIYKGMGIFTYLKSMTTMWGDELNDAIKEALGPGFVDPMDKYATSKDRAKGGTGQYSDPGKLARENVGLEYQRAIDMGVAEKNMEEVSKEFFTADVSDWMKRRSDILQSGVKSLMESQNINAITAAALLGSDKDSVAAIYKNILDYRKNRVENQTPDQLAAATDAFNNVFTIANREKNIENSVWGRAMRARALINTHHNINTGVYEENRTVEQRRQLRNDYHEFLKMHPGAAADALQIGSLSRMRDSANAIAGAAFGFMKPILKSAGIDVDKIPGFEKRVRRALGGKTIDDMSLKPGPADDENKVNQSVVNGNGITETVRSGNHGINASFRIQPGVVDDKTAERVVRRMGGLKKPGEDFTQEELDALPISPSQLHYLADPKGDENARKYGGVEEESSLNSNALGLVNQVMSGMYKDTDSGAAPFRSDVNMGNRGIYKVINEAFERGNSLEESVFSEMREKGMSSASIASKFGYRTKGHVNSKFFGAEFDSSGSAYNKGSISYEPDLLVATTDKSGKRVWEVRDIKTTSRIDKSGGDNLSNLRIMESGQWKDGELAGQYVVQQMAYVQAINEFGQNVQRKVTPLMQKGDTYADVLRRIAADTSLANGDSHLIDLSRQYTGMENWFTSKEGSNLDADRAKSEINSIISGGVVSGGLMYNIKNSDGSMERDSSGNIALHNYDAEAKKQGVESGFEKLRGMTYEQTRHELTKIRKQASNNRVERVAENIPQYVAGIVNANRRWNRDRSDVLSAINKNSGVISGALPTSGTAPRVADNEEKGRLSRELAASMPYLRTMGAEKRSSKAKNVTAEGIVAVESEFAKYGILNAGTKAGDYKEFARITGAGDSINANNAMDQRTRFRALVGAAARRGKMKTTSAKGHPEYADVSDAEYTEVGTQIARFMGESGGAERHEALQKLQKLGVLNNTDASQFKGFSNGASGSLSESREDTSRRLYSILEKKYGAQRGSLVKDSRFIVDAGKMHFSNLGGEDEKIQKGFVTSVIQTIKSMIMKSPEAREGIVRAQEANAGLATVLDENGNPITSSTGSSSNQTPAQIADSVYAGRLSGVEARQQYSDAVIPSFPALPAPAGSAAAAQIEEAKKYAHAAVANVDPELANRILNADHHMLPKLMQEGFSAIGSASEYLERANGTSEPYSAVTESWRKAAAALQNPEASSYFQGLKTSSGSAAEFLPPEIDTTGAIIGRDITAPSASSVVIPGTGAPSPASLSGSSAAPAAAGTSSSVVSAPGTTGSSSGKSSPVSAIDPATGSVSLKKLPVSLTADERSAVEKYNRYASAKKKREAGKISAAKFKTYELTPEEKGNYDAAVKKISSKEAELAAPPAPKPAPVSSSPAPTTGGPTVHSRGAVVADPDRYKNDSSQIVSYLRGFGKTNTIDPVSGVSVASYTTGKTRTEVQKLLAQNQIGTTEQKLLFNLRSVFEQLEAGRPVSSTDLSEAYDRLAGLTAHLAMTPESPEREMAMDEITRIMGVLEGDAAGRTRAAIASSGAGSSAMTSAAGSVARTRASLAGGTKASGPGSPAKPSYVDITTEKEDIERAIDQASIELSRSGGKINTNEIHQKLRHELVDRGGALWHNQNIVNGGASMTILRGRVGWDSTRADEISKDPGKYKALIAGTAAERKNTQDRLKNVNDLLTSIRGAYTKSGKKLEDDPSTHQAVQTLEAVKANLTASLGDGGTHSILEDQIARSISGSRVNELDRRAQIYNTGQIVQKEIEAGTLSVPAGESVNDFIHREATERLEGKRPGAAVGSGYTKDEKEQLFNKEYDEIREQMKKGKADVRGMFDQIKDFTEGLRQSSQGWVKKLSEDGQEAAKGFVESLDEATKTLDKYASMSEEDFKDPEKAAAIFKDLTEARKKQAEEIRAAESNPLLNTKEGAEVIRGAKENLAYIDSQLAGTEEGDLATAAAKKLGKKEVNRMLDEAGVDTTSGKSSKGREPLLGLIGAHAAYQQLIAVRTGIDPFVHAAEKYEQGRKNTNAILSAAGLNSLTPSMMAIGEEARRSAEYRRGRSSGRLGAILSDFENTGEFQVMRDVFDPVKGAGIALVPLAEPITKWAKESKKVAAFAERSAKAVALSKAAEVAGEATIGTNVAGVLGKLGTFAAANPALVAIGGGMAASALFSVVGHLVSASQDKQGMAITREIAARQGGLAAFNADPWSAIVSGNPYVRTNLQNTKTGFGYEADMARMGAIAAERMSSPINLTRPDAIKNYLDYGALAGEWRDYAKAFGVSSDAQKAAQATAATLLGGVKQGKEFENVNRALIRAQTAEGADAAAANAQAMARAVGKFSPSDIAKFLDIEDIPNGEIPKETLDAKISLDKEIAGLEEKIKVLNEVGSVKNTQASIAFLGDGVSFSGVAQETAREEYLEKLKVLKIKKDELFVKNKWTSNDAAMFIGNVERIGNPDQLEKVAMQGGVSNVEKETYNKSRKIIEDISKKGIAVDERQGSLIADSIVGNKLFEQTMLSMNFGKQYMADFEKRLGPKDSTVVDGVTYSGMTSGQREVYSQVASYAESIRNARKDSGLPYRENAGAYAAGVQFVRDSAGRATAMERNSMDQNTYNQFQKDQIDRLVDQYGMSEMRIFRGNQEFLNEMGWSQNRISQIQTDNVAGVSGNVFPAEGVNLSSATINSSVPATVTVPSPTPSPSATSPRKGKGGAGMFSPATIITPTATLSSTAEYSVSGSENYNSVSPANSSSALNVPYVSQIANGWNSQCGPASFAMLTGVISPEIGTYAGMQQIAIEDGNIVANSNGKYVETKGLNQYSSFSSLMDIAEKWDIPVRLESIPFLNKYKKGSRVSEEEKNAKPENAKQYPYIALVHNNSLPKKWSRNKTNTNHFIVVTSPTTYNDPAWPKKDGENLPITPEQLEKAEHDAWAKYGNTPRQRIYLNEGDKRLSFLQDALYPGNNEGEISSTASLPVSSTEVLTNSNTNSYSENVSGIPLKEIPYYIKKIEDSSVSSSAIPATTLVPPTATRVNPTATVSAASTTTPVFPTATATPAATQKPIWAASYTSTPIPSKTPTSTPTAKDFSSLTKNALYSLVNGPAIPSRTPTPTPTAKDFSSLTKDVLRSPVFGEKNFSLPVKDVLYSSVFEEKNFSLPAKDVLYSAISVPAILATATNIPATSTPTATPTSTSTKVPTSTSTKVAPTQTPTATAIFTPTTAPTVSPTQTKIAPTQTAGVTVSATPAISATATQTATVSSFAPIATVITQTVPISASGVYSGNAISASNLSTPPSINPVPTLIPTAVPTQVNSSAPLQKDVNLYAVEQQARAEIAQTFAKMRLSDVIGGNKPEDYSSLASRLYKKDRNGMPIQDPFIASNIETRNQLMSGGGARVLESFGISKSMINTAMQDEKSALFMQTMMGFSSGDSSTITQFSRPEITGLMNQITGGQFGETMNKYGIGPMIDVSTGGALYERSMVGLVNPATGNRTVSQSEITPGLIKSTFDPIRKQLFGNTNGQLNNARYNRINAVIAGDVFSYKNPVNGETVKLGGLSGLQMQSNLDSYNTSMGSIGVQREQMDYARERQLAWDFPVQETQNQIATAQMLGGVVQTEWMKQQGIGPLDFSGGTVTTEGMEGTVTYQGGQIGQQKFNLGMSKLEAKRGYQQGQVRFGWQVQDLSREFSRGLMRADWQREDFNVQENQMQFARQKQSYDFAFQAREMGISRQQFREDVTFQQRQRQLQFGWQMEDADTSIRRSTGFERKQLIKQKERETISFNMETEQVNRQNKRQEEAFKREEEKFKKEIDHYKQSLKFEDEAFSKQKKRFEQQRLWEEEDYAIKIGRIQEESGWATEAYQRQLARFAVEENILKQQEANEKQMEKWRNDQHQEDMNRAAKNYELNKKSLEISAGAVVNQKTIADQQVIINQLQVDAANSWNHMMNSVNWEKVMQSIKEYVQFITEHGFGMNLGKDNKNNKGGRDPEDPDSTRAKGGSVSGGKSYLIGELGPEILTMGKDGVPYILPNSAIPKDRSLSRQSGGEVIHIHVMMDSNEIATYTSDKANGLSARNRKRAFNG